VVFRFSWRDHFAMPVTGTDRSKIPVLVAFGDAVRRRRKELGYSQEGFGDACGIDRSYMGGIERGEHNIALINIMKIIDSLGVAPSEFFKDLDKKKKPTKAAT
jgi:transcriptional regulator with XRE-family HTH domain